MQSVRLVDLERPDLELVAEIDAACRECGVFQVADHGIDPRLCEALLEQMREFFALPLARKRAVERSAANAWGFYDRELTKNTRDWKQIFDVGPPEASGPLAGASPQWPEGMPGFRETLERFAAASERVAKRLLALLARSLGVEPPLLAAHFEPRHTSFLRLNYYPACDDPAQDDSALEPEAGALGINRHTDAGALTVLLEDGEPGLQVRRDGAWHTVRPRAGTLIVNIGDVVQVWSNDRYPAPEHRVLASGERERYSAPYFFNPAYAADYAPLFTPPRYRPVNWGEFRAGRAAGDYADVGAEIQVADYRIS